MSYCAKWLPRQLLTASRLIPIPNSFHLLTQTVNLNRIKWELIMRFLWVLFPSVQFICCVNGCIMNVFAPLHYRSGPFAPLCCSCGTTLIRICICPWLNTIPHKITMQTLDTTSVPFDIRSSVRATSKNKIVDQHYCAFVLVLTSFLVTDSPLLSCSCFHFCRHVLSYSQLYVAFIY